MFGMPRRSIALLGMAAAAALGVYLWASLSFYRIGFPLDDAWIHQTYARNFAQSGTWAFIPGKPSGGSTSPLWSLLLSFGYPLGLAPYVWTFLLGGLSLWGLGMAGSRLILRVFPNEPNWALAGGLLLIFEWHSVWMAGSGMETLLFSGLILAILGQLLDSRAASFRFWAVGGLTGILVWLRPDGITLLGPAIFVILLSGRAAKTRQIVQLLAGFGGIFGPYLCFNRGVAGTIWPNTFFAKQAEYAVLQQIPLVARFFRLAFLPLVGVGVVLLPGSVIAALNALKKKNWPLAAALIWAVGYIFLYTLRLPVTYQHGRYIMPMMPVLVTVSFIGFLQARQYFNSLDHRRTLRLSKKAWEALLVAITLLFFGVGANAYAQDVGVIETEMVIIARWIQANTPEDVVLGAHDIGALGFYGQREIVDLAGLISPDVIPFIRDEDQLRGYLNQTGVDYLVTFPGWYPGLVAGLEPIFQSTNPISPSLGGENMAVYEWP